MTSVDISTIHHAVYWQCTPKSIILNLRISTLRVSLGGGLENLFHKAPSSISTPLSFNTLRWCPLEIFQNETLYWLCKGWHTRMFLLRSRHHTSSWFSRRAISGSTPDCWMTSSSELRDWSCDSLLVMSSVCVYGGGPGGVGPGGVGAVSGWWCRCWLVMGCGWGGGMGWLSSNSTLLTAETVDTKSPS